MTDIPSARKKVQIEETQYKSAISESTAQKIGAAVNSIIDDGTFIIGDILYSALTEAQFQSIRGNAWVRMSGQDITGSDLATLTGKLTLPNLIGNEAHLAQANIEGELGDYQASENKSHTHTVGTAFLTGTAYSRSFTEGGTAYNTGTATTNSNGGSVARPNRYMQNIFIKIWNENQ